MTIPQPFQYQDSKRALAPLILPFLPANFQRLVDPFAGSGALTLACAARGRAKRYWLSDLKKPLAELLNLMINRPEELADAYADSQRGEAVLDLEARYKGTGNLFAVPSAPDCRLAYTTRSDYFQTMSVTQIKELPRLEKVKLMEWLWHDLSADADALEMPAWHLQELQETEARWLAGKEEVLDWQDAKRQLRDRFP